MFNKIKGLAAVTAVAMMPMASSALTVTYGEVVAATITSPGGFAATSPGGDLGVNPANVSLGNTDSASVNISVEDIAANSQGFTVVQDFTNASSVELFFETETANPGNIFTGLTFTVDTIIAGTATTIDLLANGSFLSDIGTVFTITAAATDVTGNGNFDYTISAVPLPAGGMLLLGALGAGAFASRRRKT